MPELLKTVLFNFIGAAIGAFYGALIIQLGTKVVAKFKIHYRKAYIAAFLGYAASYIVGFVLGTLFAKAGIGFNFGVILFFMTVGFLTQAAVYSLVIKTPEGDSLSFSKACLVSLIQVLAGLLLIFIASLFVRLFQGEISRLNF